jgi:hypothetical protein
MLQRTMDKIPAHLQQCLDNNGRQLHDVIFCKLISIFLFSVTTS